MVIYDSGYKLPSLPSPSFPSTSHNIHAETPPRIIHLAPPPLPLPLPHRPNRNPKLPRSEFPPLALPSPSMLAFQTRGWPNPTLGVRDPDLFGHLGSGRWDPDLLDGDLDLDKELNPNEDPDPFHGFAT